MSEDDAPTRPRNQFHVKVYLNDVEEANLRAMSGRTKRTMAALLRLAYFDAKPPAILDGRMGTIRDALALRKELRAAVAAVASTGNLMKLALDDDAWIHAPAEGDKIKRLAMDLARDREDLKDAVARLTTVVQDL